MYAVIKYSKDHESWILVPSERRCWQIVLKDEWAREHLKECKEKNPNEEYLLTTADVKFPELDKLNSTLNP